MSLFLFPAPYQRLFSLTFLLNALAPQTNTKDITDSISPMAAA
jgi:hypothetical protein